VEGELTLGDLPDLLDNIPHGNVLSSNPTERHKDRGVRDWHREETLQASPTTNLREGQSLALSLTEPLGLVETTQLLGRLVDAVGVLYVL
jgi:hypothetical protein